MYYANCEWYVDMGEHNKPLCERKSLRPAKCSECPVYIKSIEKENAKLRKFATLAWQLLTRNEPNFVWQDMVEGASELGIEEEA